MGRYRYNPLPGKAYIRHATLHPGHFEDDIVISFYTSPFPSDGSLRYEALSYVWGPKRNPLPVYVSRADFATTTTLRDVCQVRFERLLSRRNLVIALKHLRYTDRLRIMWVDALCINQADDVEKGSQVAMMGDIFRPAPRVVTWLGPAENNSNHAMDYIDFLGSQVEIEYETSTLKPAKDCTDPEIILANTEAIIMCGLYQVRWTSSRRGLVYGQIYHNLNSLYGFIFGLSKTSILELREYYEDSHSLLPKSQRTFISPPDYTKPYNALYEHVTVQCTQFYHRLRLLSDWVPDWSVSPSVGSLVGLQRASSQPAASFRFPQPVTRSYQIPHFTILDYRVDQYTVEDCTRMFETHPDIDGAKRVVLLLMSNYKLDANNFRSPSARFKFLSRVYNQVGGLRLIQTTCGYMGLASPSVAEPGDEICVVLGCDTSSLLRSLGNNKFRLIGPCFVLGLACGEAFLGLLPKNIRQFTAYNKDESCYFPCFKNSFTGDIFYENPRLNSLPVDLGEFRNRLSQHPGSRISVDPNIFQERGVNLKWFDIVLSQFLVMVYFN
ncbi:HET-domain-containing protein [Jackrogersella minutella]|nr:HET-domain-containing protein [Jackrogersella minutella]